MSRPNSTCSTPRWPGWMMCVRRAPQLFELLIPFIGPQQTVLLNPCSSTRHLVLRNCSRGAILVKDARGFFLYRLALCNIFASRHLASMYTMSSPSYAVAVCSNKQITFSPTKKLMRVLRWLWFHSMAQLLLFLSKDKKCIYVGLMHSSKELFLIRRSVWRMSNKELEKT